MYNPLDTEVLLPDDNTVFYSAQQAAALIGVSKPTLINKLNKGEIPFIRVGNLYKVPKSSLHTYLDDNKGQ